MSDSVPPLDIGGIPIPVKPVRPCSEEPLEAESVRPQWPDPIGQAAFRGLAGDVVRAIGPHSEADPAAILLQFLVAFGNAIGRTIHFVAEADEHYTNLFLVVVGVSSKGRKGTSWGWIKRLFAMADGAWMEERVVAGLSSGEGLIHAVRDRVEGEKEGQRGNGPEVVVIDPGIDDKRLLVVESEFASVLKVLQRQGNTLSPVIRCAWDHGSLRTLVKSCPESSTGAHISIVAHVTKDELIKNMADTETSNGFANRFLWCCARRSKLLPHGGDLSDEALMGIAAKLGETLASAQSKGRVERDPEANALWEKVYGDLSEGLPGLLGSVTGRAEPQVMRLATIYAMLDRSEQIRRPHLEAALAVWKYVHQSAAYIFGNSLGDPAADQILASLREAPDGLTRTEIRDLFLRHAERSKIERALDRLVEHGRAHNIKEPSKGRYVERWFFGPASAATKATNATKGPPAIGSEAGDQSDRSSQGTLLSHMSHKSQPCQPPTPDAARSPDRGEEDSEIVS